MQQPAQKSPKSALDALMAEVDAEFSKPKREKFTPDPDVEERKRRNKAFHERVAPRDPLQGNGAIVRSWQNVPGYRAVVQLVAIQQQHCRYCDGVVEFVGNQFTVFENRRSRSRVQSAELLTHDDKGVELPILLEEHLHEVDFCAKCLRLSRKVEDLIAACYINGRSFQLPLSVQAHLAEIPALEKEIVL